jgi:hypothetical protein
MDSFEPLKGYEEHYSINRNGEVYSNSHKRILKPYNNSDGYINIGLCINSIQKKLSIHRLVALQFIPNPNNYPVIDHIDRNKHNNSLDNLRWTTRSINSRNWNRPNRPNSSGFRNIYITNWGSYSVNIILDKKCIFNKTFRTLDEALSERDWAYDYYGIENPCYN